VYLTIKSVIQPGQDVIMSPYTIADIVNMIICAGGRPVFADVERGTCNINPEEVEKLIHKGTGAVLITHLHGLAAYPHHILEICKAFNVPMIEDAAQGFGAKESGKPLGTIGVAGVYSFGLYKNINTWFGGAVVSNQKQLIDKIRNELEQYDYQSINFILKKWKKGLITDVLTSKPVYKSFTYWIFRYAFLHDIEAINRKVRTELDMSRKDTLPAEYLARFTPLQARLALKQLDQIDTDSEIRIQNGLLYHEGLKDIDELILPPCRRDFSHVYTYFPIQYRERTKLLKWLMLQKRDIAAQHYKNTADLTWFKEFYRDCPNSRAVAEELIFLPTYPRYSQKEVRNNINAIREFFDKKVLY
jgi:dTDP-4-amino-4,6-dideoxygalactose transaminase